MSREISVNINDLPLKSRIVELKLTGLRWWMFKTSCAIAVVRFGVWMMGSNCEVILDEEPDEQT